MSNPSKVHIGIDVSKLHLDVALPRGRRRFANVSLGHQALLKILPANAHVLLEATGGYERPLVEALQRAAVWVSVLNPRQVRDFARAKGLLAKTDQIDAALLADYGAAMDCPPSQPVEPARRQLAELCTLRDQFVNLRSQLLQSAEHLTLPTAKCCLQTELRSLTRQIAKLEAALEKITASDRALAARSATLQANCGVGPATSTVLLALLPELGCASRCQIGALAGLAPRNDDSGPRQGPRHIQGGRSRVRRALYMAALSLIRSKSSPLAAFYRRLRANGKPAKVALIATARKLLCHLNHQLKSAWLIPLPSPS